MKHTHEHHNTLKLEKVGFYLSVLCAIHCIATPVLLTVLPFLGSSLLEDHSWELWFIAGSVLLAGIVLFKDYKRHLNYLPLLLLVASSLTKLCELWWLGEQYEFITGTVGAAFIASAYYFNWKYKAATCC